MGNLRDTQNSAESVASGTPKVRVTQISAEVVRPTAQIADQLVTQVSAETVQQGSSTNERATQLSAEVIYKAINQRGVPIPFEIQTPSQLLDEGQLAVIRRIFIDVNCQVEPASPPQTLFPTALVDLVETQLAGITNSGRSTIEIAYQTTARQFSLRLNGSLTNRVEVFGVELDCHVTGAEVTGA